MSQQANDPVAKSPVSGTPAPAPANPSIPHPTAQGQPRAAGGMKQTLKIAIPLLALVGVVFGITYFSQYTPRVDDTKGNTGGTEPPLRFGSSARVWHPQGSLQERAFPGYYEVQANASGRTNGAGFWFENRNPNSVLMQLKRVSCTVCSGGRLAPIPPAVTRQFLQLSAFQGLPQGLVSGLPMGMAGASANVAPDRLEWQQHIFRENPQATYTVPPANNVDGWSPQWGILELQFSIGTPKSDVLSAMFELQVEGSKQTKEFEFRIGYEGVEPFDLSIKDIVLGDITEKEKPEPRQYEVILFSSTRGPNGNGPGDLLPPVASVELPGGRSGDPGPFITLGTPVRVPEDELREMMRIASDRLRKPVRVESAYRTTITVHEQVDGKRMDLGPFERAVSFTVPGTVLTKTVAVKGMVRGGVFLDKDLREIVLSDTHKSGTIETFRLITKRPDAEVVLVADETSPEFMKVELEKLPPDPDRGYYQIKIKVPPESKAGPWSGVVALELKGPQPQRMRIPVRGKGGS
jgi:hypothetical protein